MKALVKFQEFDENSFRCELKEQGIIEADILIKKKNSQKTRAIAEYIGQLDISTVNALIEFSGTLLAAFITALFLYLKKNEKQAQSEISIILIKNTNVIIKIRSDMAQKDIEGNLKTLGMSDDDVIEIKY